MTVAQFANSTDFVARPGKLMRITSMAKAMLEEARSSPCDVAGCEKFKRIYQRTIDELDDVISDDLHAELIELTARFDQSAPSPFEIRVAQAELVGWLDGLMNGIVVAVRSQMMEAEEQAEALEATTTDDGDVPGQYL
jgi:hypothetical protein